MSENISENIIEEVLSSETCDDHISEDLPTNHYIVKILHSSETLVCRIETGGAVDKGNHVLVKTRYGKDLAAVMGPVKCVCQSEKGNIENIIRLANKNDILRYADNLELEKKAIQICKEKIEVHGLDMKLISSHYLLEEAKILFFFTAESRVDFRELVKDLVSVFKTRIELRQIGVRDESRVLGGLAVCGRAYCCHAVTDKMKPVSIKMAKEQSLSLNSMKISGPCGRLLCCLSYEYDFYLDEKQKYPAEGHRVISGDQQYKVLDVNVLTKKITIISSDGRFFTVPSNEMVRDDSGKWTIEESFFES